MSSTSTFGRRAAPPQERAARTQTRAWAPPRIVHHAASATAESRFDKTPYLSIGLLTLLALIFVFQPTAGLPMGPGMEMSLHNLIAVGGVSRKLVFEQGEWWRIFTAPLLHGNLAHIIGNAVVMAFAAITLERVVGRSWLAAAFVVSGLGGSAGSLLLNHKDIVSVGASGAIMGLLAMILMCSLHPAMHRHAKRLRWITLRLFIPSLIPFGAALGSTTDYNGHLGGAVAGGVLGFFLLATWDEESENPRPSRLLWIVGGAGLAMAVLAFALIVPRHETYIARGRPLIPDFMLPDKGWAAQPQAAALVEAYPHDPRGRLQLAHAYVELDNYVNAEREIRMALAEREIIQRDMRPDFEAFLRNYLVGVLAAQKRYDEAEREARPLCKLHPTDRELKEMDRRLREAGLCARAS
jgi:rhomboid protease GluP